MTRSLIPVFVHLLVACSPGRDAPTTVDQPTPEHFVMGNRVEPPVASAANENDGLQDPTTGSPTRVDPTGNGDANAAERSRKPRPPAVRDQQAKIEPVDDPPESLKRTTSQDIAAAVEAAKAARREELAEAARARAAADSQQAKEERRIELKRRKDVSRVQAGKTDGWTQ